MLRKSRKMTGCILAVLLAAAALTGCSMENEGRSRRDRESEETREEREDREDGDRTEASESGKKSDQQKSDQKKEDSDAEGLTSNIGIIQGNAYVNILMGFGCTLEDGWTFASREEIAEMSGITVDILDQAELSNAIDEGMYDMVAASADNMANVNVVIQSTGLLGAAVQEKDVVDQVLGQVEQLLGSIGYSDVKAEARTIDFIDGEHAGIYTTATINSIDFYQRQVAYKTKTHIASITVTCYGEDVTEGILAWFDKAEIVLPDLDLLGNQRDLWK